MEPTVSDVRKERAGNAVDRGEDRFRALLDAAPDVTERMHAEAVLREAQDRFRGAFDSAAIGMALAAPDGRFLEVNPSLCGLLGYSEDELLSMTWQEITHPDDLDADLEFVRQMLAKGGASSTSAAHDSVPPTKDEELPRPSARPSASHSSPRNSSVARGRRGLQPRPRTYVPSLTGYERGAK